MSLSTVSVSLSLPPIVIDAGTVASTVLEAPLEFVESLWLIPLLPLPSPKVTSLEPTKASMHLSDASSHVFSDSSTKRRPHTTRDVRLDFLNAMLGSSASVPVIDKRPKLHDKLWQVQTQDVVGLQPPLIFVSFHLGSIRSRSGLTTTAISVSRFG